MPNQITSKATANNTTKAVEFKHPITGVWLPGTYNSASGKYEALLTSVTAGTYAPGSLKCRLVGTTTEYSYNGAAVTVTGAAGGPLLARVSAGLLLQDSFAGTLGSGTGFLPTPAKSMVAFDRSPLLANDSNAVQAAGQPAYQFAPGVDSGIDGDGARESTPFIDSDGTWYHYYGGYKVNEPWRILCMKSTDRGVTWQKLGPVGIGLDKYNVGSSTPNGQQWAACDNLFIQKRGSFYYLHRLGAGTLYLGSSICGPPYISEMFRSTAPFGAPWTYICRTAQAGSDPGYNDRDTLVLDIIEYEGRFLGFSCDTSDANPGLTGGFTQYYTGLYEADNYEGPWVRQPGPLLPVALTNNLCVENPKVEFVPQLDDFVLFITMLDPDRQSTANQTNAIFVNNQKNPRDWSQATRLDVQFSSLSDGAGTVNVPAFIQTPDMGVVNAAGYLPFAFDTNQSYDTSVDPSGNRLRDLAWACLEPSPGALRTTTASAAGIISDTFNRANSPLVGSNGWQQVAGSVSPQIVNSQLVLDSSSTDAIIVNTGIRDVNAYVEVVGTFAPMGFQLVGAYQSNGDHYLAYLDDDTVTFYKNIGGAYTELFPLSANMPTPLTNATYRFGVEGGTLKFWVNGTLRHSRADSSITGPGRYGLRNAIVGATLSRLEVGLAGASVSAAAVTDTFNRANMALAGSNGWQQAAGSVSPQIVNQQLVLDSSSNDAILVNGGVNTLAGYSEVVGTFAPMGFQLVGAYQSNGNHYLAYLDNDNVTFYKNIGGSYSELFPLSDQFVLPAGPLTLRFVVDGTTLRFFVNGQIRHTLSDSSITGPGRYGFRNAVQPATLTQATVGDLTLAAPPAGLYSWTLSHTNFVAEYVHAITSVGATGSLGLVVRRQSSGNGYLVAARPGEKLALYKLSGNGDTKTLLQAGTGSQVARVYPRVGRVRIQGLGGRLRAWLDGELQLDYTDASSPYLSGTSLAARREDCVGEVRAFHLRTADTVTINGLSAGQQVVLRLPGGPPLCIKTATGSTLTFGPADGVRHFPAGEISINGTPSYTGLIWGGDTFSVT